MAHATESTSLNSSSNASESVEATVLWQVEIANSPGFPDRRAEETLDAAIELGLIAEDAGVAISSRRGFLVQGALDSNQANRVATRLLAEPVVHSAMVGQSGDTKFLASLSDACLIYVLPKVGVTDPEAESAAAAIRDLGYTVDQVRTFRKYEISGLDEESLQRIARRVLCNDSIEDLVWGPLAIEHLSCGSAYHFELQTVSIRDANDDALLRISRDGQLSLTLVEMQKIQNYYRGLERDPTDIELETIAQTWSEHCSHKTLAGKVHYDDGTQSRQFNNLLKETIFAATQNIRAELGDNDWCVSVFKDNAGIVKFTDSHNVTFKVETHNRPSAIEPYGGANTGLGGVIRDTMGTGMGAKPICSTDIFCFASPERNFESLPPGVMHPRRIIKGVVAGVRDYGNRMGIPTVNGAVYFDDRYIGNPMVFCGNVGLIPHEMSFKEAQPGDLIVVLGGRTGRDGIHGATFSSVELTEASERMSSGAVQIGNAIVEKMVLDVMLQARDRGLYNAVTDCGAGGFSSAVGEMGEEIGAEVWLDRAPLKYAGLSYTEIWISEAQERMVFAVPPEKWGAFSELCASESVEATAIGRFVPTGNLTLHYEDHQVGELSMEFLHGGRPPVVRNAVFKEQPVKPLSPGFEKGMSAGEVLRRLLSCPNVASKEWIIRQYDHEVLAGSVIKPLVGVEHDGPSDAAVVRPLLDCERGIALACGMNPLLGDLDPYHMAACSIDEAVRNCVAVGADPNRIGILDNFCWGYTDRPETLGSLVRASLACQDIAQTFKTPFISGKDSLNNEFSYTDTDGQKQTISIPATLLISALGQVPDVSRSVTMDLKQRGNILCAVGWTGAHLGGSHATLVLGLHGQGVVPQVKPDRAKALFENLHRAISLGLVRSCHDLSEGGLAAALAEMAFAGGLGAEVNVAAIPVEPGKSLSAFEKMFSESPSRFICEISPSVVDEFMGCFEDGEAALIGVVEPAPRLILKHDAEVLLDESITELKQVWQQTFDWK